MCICLKRVVLRVYMAYNYISKSEINIAALFENVCIQSGLKYETLNFTRHLSGHFFSLVIT